MCSPSKHLCQLLSRKTRVPYLFFSTKRKHGLGGACPVRPEAKIRQCIQSTTSGIVLLPLGPKDPPNWPLRIWSIREHIYRRCFR